MSRRCELVHRRSRNSPFGQQSGYAVGNRSLRQATENTASGKRAALQESHRHGIPGKRIGGSSPVQLGAARRTRGGRGARRALPWLHVVRGDRGMARESPPRMSLRVNTPSPLGCRATPAVTDNGTWQVTERAAKTRRAKRWENGAWHPWRYSRLTNRCS